MTAGVVLEAGTGRALIFDRVTGQVIKCSVPTALENVRLGQGRYVHGETGERMKEPADPKAPEPEPIPLAEEGVLPLPADESGHSAGPGSTEPFGGQGDHDGDGKAGGDAAAKPAAPKPARRGRPPARRKG